MGVPVGSVGSVESPWQSFSGSELGARASPIRQKMVHPEFGECIAVVAGAGSEDGATLRLAVRPARPRSLPDDGYNGSFLGRTGGRQCRKRQCSPAAGVGTTAGQSTAH